MSSLSRLAEGESPLAKLIGDLNERPCKVIPFPGYPGIEVGLWALTHSESEQARKVAYEWVRTTLKFSEIDLAYDDNQAIRDAIAIETLFVALRDPKLPINSFAKDSNEIRQRLKVDDIAKLHQEYAIFLDETSAWKQVADLPKEVDELVDLMGKGYPIAARLSFYASSSLRGLLLTAVDQLANAQTNSSSDSSSASDSVSLPTNS